MIICPLFLVDLFSTLQDDAAPRMDNIVTETPTGPMTRSRAKAIQDKVNSLLSHRQLDPPMNGLLPQANVLCILRFEANVSCQVGAEDGGQDDVKICEEYQTTVIPPGGSGTTADTPQAADTLQGQYYHQPPAVLPDPGTTGSWYYRILVLGGSTAGGTGTATGETPKPSVYPPGTRSIPASFYSWQGIPKRLDTVLPLGHWYYRCCCSAPTPEL